MITRPVLTAHPLRLLALASLLTLFPAAEAAAQRGGAGRGGAGGAGAMRGAATMPSPADMIKQQIESNDPYTFLLEHRKELALRNPQRDSIRDHQKEMKKEQEPLFKELHRHMPKSMPQGGARPAMPDTVRELMSALSAISKAHEERSWSLLDEQQRPRADTLHIQWMVNRRAARGGRP